VAVREEDLRAVIHASRGDEGQPYQQRANESDRYALEGLYLNRGFRQAKVEITATFSPNGQDVTRVVRIVEGPLITIGDIRIVGWHHISEKAIREELALGVSQPYSEAARLESRRRINGMGVFSRVTVQEDPLMPGETEAHLVVRVVEAPATTIGFGGGVQAGRKARSAAGGGYTDRLEFAPRGSVEVGRRNVGGRNRTINLFTRISLRPKDVPGVPALDGKGYSFSEYKATVTYRERRAFGTDIDWVLSLTSEQAIRTSFNFVRQAANADFVRRLTARTTANLRYSLDFTRLYDVRFSEKERLDIDRVFNQVRLSMVSLAVVTDHRDDAISPSRGTFTSGEGDFALRGIGSEVGFGKLFLQASAYRCVFSCAPDRRIGGPGRSVLAVRGEIGVARGFSRPIVNQDGTLGTVADLPASQRFFAGGSTTVRGFQLDRLGVPAVLTTDGLPFGGNGLVVLNAELRTVVGKLLRRNLSTVQFADGGNVFAKTGDIRLGQLRATLGTGVRYDSPIGPIRLDFGFKLSRLLVGGRRERGWEYHLSFGEAF
jgi:outer membrane protein assembly factor BamA